MDLLKELDDQIRSYLSIDLVFRKILITLCAIALIIEMFHFLVLSQKEMRSIAINILLMVMALCHIIQLFIRFPVDWKQVQDYGSTAYCFGYASYNEAMKHMIFSIISLFSNDISSILTLMMSVIRAISIAFPMSSLTSKLSTVGYTIKVIMIICVVQIMYTFYANSLEYHVTLRKPGSYCGLASNQSIVEREQYRRELVRSDPYFASLSTGIFIVKAISQPAIHIFATKVLISELREAARIRRNVTSSSIKDNTTKIVTFMTIAYFISEVPQVLAAIYLIISQEDSRFINRALLFPGPISILSVLNGASHFVICFFLSSQYKDTVKTLLRVPKRGTTVWSMEQSAPNT